MPLLRVGIAIVLSPLLLLGFVMAVNVVIPGYASGAQGMGTLAGLLRWPLVAAGALAMVAAMVSFWLMRARERESVNAR